MMARHAPFRITATVMGALSVPLSFMGHLVSLAVVLAAMGTALSLTGWWLQQRKGSRRPLRAYRWALLLSAAGGACAAVMWVLWSMGALLRA